MTLSDLPVKLSKESYCKKSFKDINWLKIKTEEEVHTQAVWFY